MIHIEVNNNKCKITGPIKDVMRMQKDFKVRNPNAYFIRLKGFAKDGWDGKIDYITDAGYFRTGLLPEVVIYVKEVLKTEVKLIDNRPDPEVKPKFPKKVGNLEPRGYQEKAIRAIIENEIEGLHFPIGVEKAATNAGKTMIMAGIYLAYKRKIPALVLIKEGDLYDQFKKEIPELVGDDAGFVRGKEKNWNKFTVAMVQTLARDVNKYKNELAKIGMVLVDEADLADNKSYKSILTKCYNANIRVGLSGSIYTSKLAKHKPKNMNLKSYFGNIVFEIPKIDMVELGHSTRIVIKVFKGSKVKPDPNEKDWKAEYDRGITYNEDRINKIIDRIKFNAKLGRLPALVIGQFHNHIELMHSVFQNKLGDKYTIDYVHGARKDRKKILERFRKGKIDILISSFIIKRGQNLPLTKLLINAAGSDSQATVIQLMGRLERKHESKNKAYMEDFFDEGKYLKRHSKHRVIYYKQEKFKVYEKYKQ